MGVIVVHEPWEESSPGDSELCVLCQEPTRYWWGDGCTPLCQECAKTATHMQMVQISRKLKLGPIPRSSTTAK